MAQFCFHTGYILRLIAAFSTPHTTEMQLKNSISHRMEGGQEGKSFAVPLAPALPHRRAAWQRCTRLVAMKNIVTKKCSR
jgi:hypothetical protein